MRLPTRLNVGVLGLAHDHVWANLAALARGDLGRLVAVAEPAPGPRRRLAQEHGGIACADAYDAVLERDDLDAVLVFADNRTGAELAVRALQQGLPTLVEKPMAADLAGADAMLGAAGAGQAPLMVNWPTAWRPAIRHGLRLVGDGAVGEPVQLSHRGGHAGPREFGCSAEFCDWLYDRDRNGAGALVDYCGYGALLARTLLGRPATVTAVAAHLRKEGLAAEDNAVIVLGYPRALALLEGSWTQIGGEPAFGMIVYGESGTLLVHQPRATREGERVGPGRVQLVTHEAGVAWVDPPPLPAEEQDGVSYFLSRLRAGQPIQGLCEPQVGRDVQAILAAALRASAEGRSVPLA